jgi:hypothetical protein
MVNMLVTEGRTLKNNVLFLPIFVKRPMVEGMLPVEKFSVNSRCSATQTTKGMSKVRVVSTARKKQYRHKRTQ